jgi:hypothetical protein
MTEADSVHSTPRKTASKIVEFPKKPIKPAKRKSALVGLRDSGLDLMPRKKAPKGELATNADYAKIKFQALKRDEGVMRALGEGWHRHGISARVAYASMIIRGALASDDATKAQGGETRFRVRETPDWKEHAAGLEAEMLRRGMSFEVIDWSEDQATLRFEE